MVIYDSPNWTKEGVCVKHMINCVPCLTCIEEFDADVTCDLDKTTKDHVNYGIIDDEYLRPMIKEIRDFRLQQAKNHEERNGE